jgi:hypothetical protein
MLFGEQQQTKKVPDIITSILGLNVCEMACTMHYSTSYICSTDWGTAQHEEIDA